MDESKSDESHTEMRITTEKKRRVGGGGGVKRGFCCLRTRLDIAACTLFCMSEALSRVNSADTQNPIALVKLYHALTEQGIKKTKNMVCGYISCGAFCVVCNEDQP